MDRDEHLNNNNNRILPATNPSDTQHSLDQGRTESDAIHFRLRSDNHTLQNVYCLSCHQTFPTKSLLDIYEHYAERVHSSQYSTCLYCRGRVHQYRRADSEHLEIYHHCLRSKRGEDL